MWSKESIESNVAASSAARCSSEPDALFDILSTCILAFCLAKLVKVTKSPRMGTLTSTLLPLLSLSQPCIVSDSGIGVSKILGGLRFA